MYNEEANPRQSIRPQQHTGADPGFILGGGVYEEIGHVPKNLGHHHIFVVHLKTQKQKKKRSTSVLRPCSPITY
jgi:hypothetical protein